MTIKLFIRILHTKSASKQRRCEHRTHAFARVEQTRMPRLERVLRRRLASPRKCREQRSCQHTPPKCRIKLTQPMPNPSPHRDRTAPQWDVMSLSPPSRSPYQYTAGFSGPYSGPSLQLRLSGSQLPPLCTPTAETTMPFVNRFWRTFRLGLLVIMF